MSTESSGLPQLSDARIDYLVSTLKGVVGAVPVVGSLAAEAIGVAIPKQRMDRMADVLQKTADRIDSLEANLASLPDRFRTPEFIDVFEEAMLQAGKALSNERRQYIANILVAGLSTEHFDNARVKKLLFLLDSLTDPEIIVLTHAALQDPQQRAFYELHRETINPPQITATSSAMDRERAAVHESYWPRLNQLGLASPQQTGYYDDVTPIGRLLLRYIGALSET